MNGDNPGLQEYVSRMWSDSELGEELVSKRINDSTHPLDFLVLIGKAKGIDCPLCPSLGDRRYFQILYGFKTEQRLRMTKRERSLSTRVHSIFRDATRHYNIHTMRDMVVHYNNSPGGKGPRTVGREVALYLNGTCGSHYSSSQPASRS